MKKINLTYCFILTLSLLLFSEANSQSSFSGTRLKEGCINFIQKKVGNDCEISISQKIKDVKFTESDIKAKFVANPNSLKGNTNVGIEFSSNDKLIKRLEIPVRIKIFKIVPVAAQSLSKGKIIEESDFIQQKVDVTNFSESELTGDKQIIGMKVKRNITKGAVITNVSIDDNTGIQRGERVILVLQNGSIAITASGTSLQDGNIGQTIRVKREGTQNIIEGSVGENKTVLVNK